MYGPRISAKMILLTSCRAYYVDREHIYICHRPHETPVWDMFLRNGTANMAMDFSGRQLTRGCCWKMILTCKLIQQYFASSNNAKCPNSLCYILVWECDLLSARHREVPYWMELRTAQRRHLMLLPYNNRRVRVMWSCTNETLQATAVRP